MNRTSPQRRVRATILVAVVVATGFIVAAFAGFGLHAITGNGVMGVVAGSVVALGVTVTVALTLWFFLEPFDADRLDALDGAFDTQRRLLDDVRHELKTPITIVRGHLEVMNPNDPEDAAAIRDLGMAELDRMTRLIGDIDLLAAVESDSFTMGDVDLALLTRRIQELVGVISEHEWRVEQTAVGIVRADRDRLLQAWLQLADNAAKYTPTPGSIELGSALHASSAQLWVRDHGPGVPPALRHRIFRRFDRGTGKRAVGGSGLGLAIVETIARAHGGTCSIADTPGGGATFTIEIPIGTRAPLPSPVRAGDVLVQREASA